MLLFLLFSLFKNVFYFVVSAMSRAVFIMHQLVTMTKQKHIWTGLCVKTGCTTLPETVWGWDSSLVQTSATTVTYWRSAGEERTHHVSSKLIFCTEGRGRQRTRIIKIISKTITFTYSHDRIWYFLFSFDSGLMNSHIASAMRRTPSERWFPP